MVAGEPGKGSEEHNVCSTHRISETQLWSKSIRHVPWEHLGVMVDGNMPQVHISHDPGTAQMGMPRTVCTLHMERFCNASC